MGRYLAVEKNCSKWSVTLWGSAEVAKQNILFVLLVVIDLSVVGRPWLDFNKVYTPSGEDARAQGLAKNPTFIFTNIVFAQHCPDLLVN